MPVTNKLTIQSGKEWKYADAKVFGHDRTFTQPIVWITTLFMVAFHIDALAALFLFSWKALLLALAPWWAAGSLSIGIGYHRLLTHRGYKTPKWMEYCLTICGTLALEGGPIFWVATHRLHHQNTDKEGDPHSPRNGGFWAHMGWLLTGRTMRNNAPDLLPYLPDLRKDSFHVWISRWRWVPIKALGAVLVLVVLSCSEVGAGDFRGGGASAADEPFDSVRERHRKRSAPDPIR